MENQDITEDRTNDIIEYLEKLKDYMISAFNHKDFDGIIETAKKSIGILMKEYNNVNFKWKGKIPIAIDALLDYITMAKKEKEKLLTKEKTVV